MLILSRAEVEDLLDLEQAMSCLQETFAHQAQGEVTAWQPLALQGAGPTLRVRSGGLTGQGYLGLRMTCEATSVACLFESPSGRLASVMEYPFSALRLAASVGLGVRQLGPSRVRRLGMFGSGRLGMIALQSVCTVCPPEEVRLFSPNEEHRRSFAERAAVALGVPVTATGSPEAAAEDAGLILTATNSPAPVLQSAWLARPALVVAMGARSEVDEGVFDAADLVVTTSRKQEESELGAHSQGTLGRLMAGGALPAGKVVELGEVVTGRVAPVRAGRMVFREAQGGFTDVALAAYVFRRAVELGRGLSVGN